LPQSGEEAHHVAPIRFFVSRRDLRRLKTIALQHDMPLHHLVRIAIDRLFLEMSLPPLDPLPAVRRKSTPHPHD
jgi:hypothetical protein